MEDHISAYPVSMWPFYPLLWNRCSVSFQIFLEGFVPSIPIDFCVHRRWVQDLPTLPAWPAPLIPTLVLNVVYQASDFKCILLPDYIYKEISSTEISNMITIKMHRK